MNIFLNQVGFLPNSKKTAVITEKADEFKVVSNDKIVFNGKISPLGFDEASGDDVYLLDFSELETAGTYQIKVNDSLSCKFEISPKIFNPLHNTMIKALYFQRCGCELKEEHAGIFKHGICHTEKSVLLEDPEVFIDTTGGWHDAGDYGRYITPAATTIAHLLYAYKLFPGAFKESLNIPESENQIDDVINECKYELDWMLKMQDKNGGVYHKLTSFTHANFVMPEYDKKQMIVFPVSSMATAAYVGSMALAYDVFKDIDKEYAEKLLESSKLSYSWLDKNPDFIGFENPKGCNTGEYGDSSDLDERFWAAAEMYKATGESKYLDDFMKLKELDFSKTDLGWGSVSGFGSLSYILNPNANEKIKDELKELFASKANEIKAISASGKYGVTLPSSGYKWGSNMTVCVNGMQLIINHLLNEDKSSIDIASGNLDYLLGKNALGYSYVTGFGENAYRNPHNRPTVADGIDECIAGFVSGGPNGTPQDEKAEWMIVPGTPPMKCYLDIWECYSLNEITIYWNSPAIFITAYFYHND